MRNLIIDGTSFECPRYVVRVPLGWQVRLPNVKTLFFGDTRYGSVTESHKAALSHRDEALPINEETENRYALVERKTKRNHLGIPGVFLVYHPRRGKRAPQVELLVSIKGQPTRTIYVGTTKTWEARLPEKLEIARTVRMEKIKLALQSTGK